MKAQHQIILVALAILFTVALAFTIAMLCVSAFQRETETPTEPIYPPEWTQPFISNEPITTLLPSPEETKAPSTTEIPDLGFSFLSNRNGTCTLTGLGTYSDQLILIPSQAPNGDLVTAIAPRALMGCELATAIQIPETVVLIGDLAFANCPNLVYVSVSKYNPYYKDIDGVLYTLEEDVLLLYPPTHTGSSVYLSTAVNQIADMAFYQCAYLSSVRFEGTAEEWHLIEIGSKNYSLTAASVVFSARIGA